jgi:hypothetical protein
MNGRVAAEWLALFRGSVAIIDHVAERERIAALAAIEGRGHDPPN